MGRVSALSATLATLQHCITTVAGKYHVCCKRGPKQSGRSPPLISVWRLGYWQVEGTTNTPGVPEFLTLVPSFLIIFLNRGNCCILSSDFIVMLPCWHHQSSGLEGNAVFFLFFKINFDCNIVLQFPAMCEVSEKSSSNFFP